MFDLKMMSEEQFVEHENAVVSERERRRNQANIPLSIAAQARSYVEGGGDLADLVAAVNQE